MGEGNFAIGPSFSAMQRKIFRRSSKERERFSKIATSSKEVQKDLVKSKTRRTDSTGWTVESFQFVSFAAPKHVWKHLNGGPRNQSPVEENWSVL